MGKWLHEERERVQVRVCVCVCVCVWHNAKTTKNDTMRENFLERDGWI